MKRAKRTICIKSETSFIFNTAVYPTDKCRILQRQNEQWLRERMLKRQASK